MNDSDKLAVIRRILLALDYIAKEGNYKGRSFVVIDGGAWISESDAEVLWELLADEPGEECACINCNNVATETPDSPYMDEYCDRCTNLRCDIPPMRDELESANSRLPIGMHPVIWSP